MQLEIRPEYRQMLAKMPNMVIDIPSSTPAHIRARLAASSVAFCEKRSVSPIEDSTYQNAAARFHASRPVSDQTGVLAQIAAFNKRYAKKKLDVGDVRSIAAKYPELTLEDISRAIRLGYSE